jgi:hypothetical protein
MTMSSAAFARSISPRRINPREARAAVTEAAARLQIALDTMAKADADEASAKIADAKIDADAKVVLDKAAARRNRNVHDGDKAWLTMMAGRLRQLSFDVGEPNVAELRIGTRIRELADEAARVLRSLS